MFGNLINNRQFKALRDSKVIEIDPFSEPDLSTVHYTLHVNKIKRKLDNGDIVTAYDFSENKNPFTLKAEEYVIVEVLEMIKLNDDNIIGQFISSSNLINEGLLLIAGKIDKKYGTTGPQKGKSSEMINFGLKNLTSSDIIIKPNHRVAHLSLYDLRGVSSEKANLTKTEIDLRVSRVLKAMEDGVDYSDEKN